MSDGHDEPRARHRSASRRPSRSVGDYLGAVRRHFVWFLLVALVVGAGLLSQNLVASPVFESFATIQIDVSAGRRDALEEIVRPDAQSADAEMEVMRSLSTALRAAALTPKDLREIEVGNASYVAPPTVLVEQVNAYRPLESLLRSFGREPAPCVLDAEVSGAGGPMGWAVSFRREGEGLRASFRPDVGAPQEVAPFRFGETYDVGGYSVRLLRKEGDPEGKAFHLALRGAMDTARWLKGGTVVVPIGRFTGIVRIGFEAASPHTAQRMADYLAGGYLGLKRAQRSDQVANRLSWLNGEIDRVRGELGKAELARDLHLKSAGSVLLGDRSQSVISQQSLLMQRRYEIGVERGQVQAARKRLLEDPADPEVFLSGLPSSELDPWTASLVNKVTDLRASLAVLGQPQAHPDAMRLDLELREVTKQLGEAAVRLRRQKTKQLEVSLAELDARLEQTIQQEETLSKQLQDMPEIERRHAELERPVKANERILEFLVQRQKEDEVAQASVISAARLIDPAFLPEARKKPVLWQGALFAALLGTAAGIAVAFLLERMDHRVRSAGEIERATDLPSYGAIPAFSSVRRRARRQVVSSLVARDAPNSTLAEAYRALRANVKFSSLDRPLSVLAVTSALPQEGKTVTVSNLAVVLADGGSRVLIVDADVRRPSTHVCWEVPRAPGLSDAIEDQAPWKDHVRPTSVPRVWLLPAGREVGKPGDLLASDWLARALGEAREQYDYVIFDLPPTLAVVDAAPLFRLVDGVLLVVRYQRPTLPAVQAAVAQIERQGGVVLGTVFNAFDARTRGRDQYGSYGYYGYYGDQSGRASDAPRGRVAGHVAPASPPPEGSPVPEDRARKR